jgi:hypothetical protein
LSLNISLFQFYYNQTSNKHKKYNYQIVFSSIILYNIETFNKSRTSQHHIKDQEDREGYLLVNSDYKYIDKTKYKKSYPIEVWISILTTSYSHRQSKGIVTDFIKKCFSFLSH